MTTIFQNSKSKLFSLFLIFNIICILIIFIKSKSPIVNDFWKYYYYFFLLNIIISLIILKKNPRNEIKKIIILSYLAFYLSFFTFEIIILNNEKKNKEIDIENIILKKKKVDDFIKFSKKFENLTIVNYPRDNFDNKQKLKNYPLSGVSMSKTLFCDEGEGYSFYNSDRFGFNNKDEIWNEEAVDYVVIGDSTAHGACVPREKNFISRLSIYSKKKFINLSYRGNGPLLEYATLKEYAPEIKFKTIILVISSVNDMQDLKNEMNVDLLQKYLQNDSFKQSLPKKQKEIDTFLKKKIQSNMEIIKKEKINYDYSIDLKKTILLGRSRNILHNLDRYINSYSINKKQTYDINKKQFKNVLQKFIDFSDKNRLNFQVILFWDWTTLETNEKNTDHLVIKDVLDDLNIKYIDVEQIMHNYKKDYRVLFPNSTINTKVGSNHFNAHGYDLIAKNIYKKLK